MSSLQKAAIVSTSLHVVLFLLAITPPFFTSSQKRLPSRHIIVDFVKIGPKSAAPRLGPQSVGKINPENKPADTSQAAATIKKEKKVIENKPKEIDKKDVKKIENPERKTVNLKKDNKKIENKKADEKKDNKNIAKKADLNKKNEKKGTAKKKVEQKTSVNKAKVDLSKKGTAAKSIGDLLGKMNKNEKSGGNNSAFAETFGEELTGTDIDLLNQHMKKFWNMPSGHEKAHNIVVEIELFIRKDCVVEKAKIVDQRRLAQDPEFRIAAESALRAVLDPECSPLPLDLKKYEQWKHMIFVFDPVEMCG